MDQKHLGALSEFLAVAALLERGFDVFRNVSQHGLADIVAVDWATGETFLIDVKTARDGQFGNEFRRTLTQEQIDAKVNLIQVTRDGKFSWTERVAINATSLYKPKEKTAEKNEPEQHQDRRPDLSGKPVFKVFSRD